MDLKKVASDLNNLLDEDDKNQMKIDVTLYVIRLIYQWKMREVLVDLTDKFDNVLRDLALKTENKIDDKLVEAVDKVDDMLIEFMDGFLGDA